MKRFVRASSIAVTSAALAVTGIPVSALASHPTETFQYLIASGLLCGLPEPNPCPAIAMGANGETIELTGEGTFTLHPKSVTGGGTFVHKNAAGETIATGTWTATRVLSFRSYGSGSAQGLPENFWGGRLRLRVHLTPEGDGPGVDAVLTVFCTIGDRIPPHAMEGVELQVRGAPDFREIVSGLTLYIRQ